MFYPRHQSKIIIVAATFAFLGCTHTRTTPETIADEAISQLGAYVLFYSRLPNSPDELRQAKGLSEAEIRWALLGPFSIKGIGKQVGQISFINSQGQPDYRNVMVSGKTPPDLLPDLTTDPYFGSDSNITNMSSRLTDPKTLIILSH